MSVAVDLQQMSFEDYCAHERMNASTIVHGFKSMLHLKRAMEGEVPEETAAMRFGQQYHKLILEPEIFARDCVIEPDFGSHPDNVTDTGKRSTRPNTKWAEARRSEFASQNSGKAIVQQKYYDKMLKMLQSLHTHQSIPDLIRSSRREVSVFGKICHTEFKGRIDLLDLSGQWGITDLKGTNDVRPFRFGELACRLCYPEKMAIYRELVRQETGQTLPVHIIAAETDGDFDRCLMPLPEPVLDHAFGRVYRLVLQYEDATKSGKWPGIDKGEELVDFYVPNYWMPDDEEMEWS